MDTERDGGTGLELELVDFFRKRVERSDGQNASFGSRVPGGIKTHGAIEPEEISIARAGRVAALDAICAAPGDHVA